jgi:hypothetical protein
MWTRRTKRLRGLQVVLALGSVLLLSLAARVTSAESPAPEEILEKLDRLLTAMSEIQQGNPTVRWDRNLPALERFVILKSFNREAVLDKETGLVWEKSPQTAITQWSNAISICLEKTVGGRKGWRLPSVHELQSLIDPSVAAPGPTLPQIHPFLNVQSAHYWSASTRADYPTGAWTVFFGSGIVGSSDKTTDYNHSWCVRGGHNDGSMY